MSCGISSSFPEVFPTSGQVTHVLLTRPPLDSGSCPPGLARLACVKHAASVHSEPGSNSPLKSVRTARAFGPDRLMRVQILLCVSENSGFSKKPGKRRLARSTQFSRNRTPGEPRGRAVPPAQLDVNSRILTEIPVSLVFLGPSSVFSSRRPPKATASARGTLKDRGTLAGCAI
jgi:hypothetical protein